MSEFFILGLVPGTNIQITFLPWLIMAGGLFVTAGLWVGHRARLFTKWVVITMLIVATRRRPDVIR